MVDPKVVAAPAAKGGKKKTNVKPKGPATKTADPKAKTSVKSLTKAWKISNRSTKRSLASGKVLVKSKVQTLTRYEYKLRVKKRAVVKRVRGPRKVLKPIGGPDKTGPSRLVFTYKRRNNYPTLDPMKRNHRSRKCLYNYPKPYLRPSLTPGTVVILLAGRHQGKRVIFLKQLASGLLLVTGPMRFNTCPIRRVSQNYVIATSKKINISEVVVPEHIDDDYFKRKREKRPKQAEGDIFTRKSEVYKPTQQRKDDQKVVDRMVCLAIHKQEGGKKGKGKHLFYKYLSTMFGLRSSQYAHRLKF